MKKEKNKNMYKLYEEYKETMKISKKARNKRQKINKELRELYDKPYARQDYNYNKNDITNWNSMIRNLEEDMKMIEMYLDFDDRYYLHKEYNDTKSMIYNQNSYEGIIPLEEVFGETIPDTTEIVTNVETQEEICKLLDDVLTERQRQVIYMYFWKEMTQEEIAKKIGIRQQNVQNYLQNALEKLRKSIKID